MFKDSTQGDLNGFLDAGSQINGELRFEDTFRVDGKLTGKVVSEGDLVVGEQGEIDGEIEVGRVFISGVVRGSITAGRRAELTAGGKVYADIETPTLVIEEGAYFEGSCRMSPRASKVRRLPVGGEKGN
jgi:cytoskeletal protein CcmA (bactofilin family)